MAARLLWITATDAAEAVTGREAYSRGLIEALQSAPDIDMTVHVALANPDDRRSSWIKAASLVSRYPAMAAASRRWSNRRRIREALRLRWDVVVVDHLQLGWVVRSLRKRGPAVIYVSHNHEASARRTTSHDAARLSRAILWIDRIKVRSLERRVAADAHVTTAITDLDARSFRGDGVKNVFLVPPVALRDLREDAPAIGLRPRSAVHFGSADWSAKLRNLRETIAAAGPVFRHGDLRLAVAGSGTAEALREREPLPCVDVLGQIDEGDIHKFLSGFRAALVVEPRGGGFKMKVLDFVAARVPMYVLRGSVQGFPLVDRVNCRLGDTVDDLVRICAAEIDDVELLDDLQEAAAAELSRFTHEAARSALISAIERALAEASTRGERAGR